MEKFTRYFFGFLGSIVLTYAFGTFFVGCNNNDKKGGGGDVVVTPVSPSGCPGCPSGMTLLATGLGRSYGMSYTPRMEMGIDFYGTSPTGAAAGNQGFFNGYYNGQAGARARLRVLVNDVIGCNIPVGDYDLVVQGATATWSGERVYNLQLQSISGPAQLQMMISGGFIVTSVPAAVSSWGTSYPYKFQSTYVQINSNAPVTNGGFQSCGSFPFTFE